MGWIKSGEDVGGCEEVDGSISRFIYLHYTINNTYLNQKLASLIEADHDHQFQRQSRKSEQFWKRREWVWV